MSNPLIEKAKAYARQRRFGESLNKDQSELVKAFLDGEVTYAQINKAIGYRNRSGAYMIVTRIVAQLYDPKTCKINWPE